MRRPALPALALGLALALPAAATDLGAMTEAERSAFRDEVKAYLMEHPEVLIEAIDVLNRRQAEAEAASDAALLQTHAEAIYSDPASWVGGNPAGDVTVVEFTDYRCGYCRKAYDEVNELVRSDGNIRLVLKEYPILGEASLISARFAVAVLQTGGNDAYRRAHDRLITLRGDPTSTALDGLAAELGLEPAAIRAKMTSPEVDAVILANHALGETLKISGTPTFIIDGTVLRGYVPLDTMRQIVSDERAG